MKEVEGLTQETSSLSSLYHGNLILLNFFDTKLSCKNKGIFVWPKYFNSHTFAAMESLPNSFEKKNGREEKWKEKLEEELEW